jgi:hypothetical protein
VIALLCGLAPILPARAEERPPRVTSQSAEYCAVLVRRVEALLVVPSHPSSEEAVELAAEGRRLCDQGHMRGGIMRLRMALMILRTPPDPR